MPPTESPALQTVYIIAPAGSPGSVVLGSPPDETIQHEFSKRSYLENRVAYFKTHWQSFSFYTDKEIAVQYISDSSQAVFTVVLPSAHLTSRSENKKLEITSTASFANFQVSNIREISFHKVTFGKVMTISLPSEDVAKIEEENPLYLSSATIGV